MYLVLDPRPAHLAVYFVYKSEHHLDIGGQQEHTRTYRRSTKPCATKFKMLHLMVSLGEKDCKIK